MRTGPRAADRPGTAQAASTRPDARPASTHRAPPNLPAPRSGSGGASLDAGSRPADPTLGDRRAAAAAPVVLIPAYEPGDRLVPLVRDLLAAAPERPVVVVDDGSGPAYADVFDATSRAGAIVLRHRVNRGKGAALRTGLAAVRDRYPGSAVVCADSDGQHLVEDIARVAERVAAPGTDGAIVLGARSFAGEVPLRSRLGNEVTRWFVRLAAGLRLRDTQTGLRGYPASLIDWLLDVPGDRFEYEMAALVRAQVERRPIVEVPIATVYLDGNSGSHFRPLADSARVYAPLLKFVASSLLAAVLDVVGLVVLMALTGSLLLSVVGARLGSATVNFVVNRRVFAAGGRRAPLGRSAARYAGLAGILLAANYLLMAALTGSGVGLLLAKLATEATLYLTSFAAQHRVVFSRSP